MEAGFRGVLNCITDPLHLNVAFKDEQDIFLIDRNAAHTAERLAALFASPERLYELARANWERFREVFDVDRQLWARARLITAELLREEALVMRPAAPFSTMDNVIDAAADAERRHDALLAEYRKLAAALDEVKAYSDQRHAAHLAENHKLAAALDKLKAYSEQRHTALLAENHKLATRLAVASTPPVTARMLADQVARRVLPGWLVRLFRPGRS